MSDVIKKWRDDLAKDNMQKTYQWTNTEFKLSNGTKFNVMHNVPTNNGGINDIDAAFQSWLLRTDEYTCLSFCRYINSKREKGYSNHYAFPFDDKDKLQ